MAYTFLFKATSDNQLYRDDETVDLGSVTPTQILEKEFVFSSPDVDTKLVNVGIHFENATDYDSMRMLKLLGSEYPNQYGLYIEQSYVINGIVTKNPDGSSPDLNVVNEAPASIDRTGSTFRFYLKNIPTDTTGSGIPIVITDSINTLTWTETATGSGIFGAPGAPGVAAGSSINHTTGLVTLVYTGAYSILNTSTVLSTYNSLYVSSFTDTGREELEDTYLVKNVTDVAAEAGPVQGAAAAHTITLANSPVTMGSIVYTDTTNTVVWTDNNDGTLVGVGALADNAAGNVINYGSGVFTVNYTAPVAIAATDTIAYQYFESSSSLTDTTLKIVNYLGVATTNSVDVLAYDPDLKLITIDTDPVGLTTLVAPAPYTPVPGDKYQITGVTTRFVSYDRGYTDLNKFIVAARSGEIQSPNEKVKVTFGIALPPALFLENQAEAFRLFEIKPVITYSVESEL